MTETWLEGAIWQPGPQWKTGRPPYTSRAGDGAVVHSAEGSLAAALGVLAGPKYASWHLTVAQDGTCYQHYPLETITWHAGAGANYRYVGIECEGVAGEDLTEAQLAALIAVLRQLKELDSWPAADRETTLREHNEFMATACPSGRIPWDRILDALRDWPGPSREEQLRALVAAAFVVSVGNPLSDLSPEDRAAVRWVAEQL